MDLTGALLRFVARAPRVLITESPGATAARLAVERAVRRRGWPNATSPVDADIVIAVSPNGAAQSGLERIWAQVPRPRAHGRVAEWRHADEVLDRARAVLAAGGEPGGAAPAGADPGTLAELPMADRGPDRDGLALDQLHVPLGPLLSAWPAGLVLHTTLQGDVLRRAEVELIHSGPVEDFWNGPWRRAASGEAVLEGEAARRRCAAHLDSLGRLLDVAGWDSMALRVRWARDEVLTGTPADRVGPPLRRLMRRLRGSRTLHRLTSGLGVLAAPERDRLGADVAERWRRWSSVVEYCPGRFDSRQPLRESRGPRGEPGSGSALALDRIPELVAGTEFTGARLIVAGFDPDLAELAASEHRHG